MVCSGFPLVFPQLPLSGDRTLTNKTWRYTYAISWYDYILVFIFMLTFCIQIGGKILRTETFRNDVIKVTPSAGVTFSTFLGFSWNEWVYILTCIYTVIQIGWLLYKMYKAIKEEQINSKVESTQKNIQ